MARERGVKAVVGMAREWGAKKALDPLIRLLMVKAVVGVARERDGKEAPKPPIKGKGTLDMPVKREGMVVSH
jgi:hypothetical protein